MVPCRFQHVGIILTRLLLYLQAMETRKQKESSPQMLEKLRYQFKIIDYGLANFDETYAAGPDVVVVEVSDHSLSSKFLFQNASST